MKKFVLLSVACLILVFGSFTFARDQSVCDSKYPETQYDARIDYCVCPTVEQKSRNKYTYCGFLNGEVRVDNIYNYEPRGPKITSSATRGWAKKKTKPKTKKQEAKVTSIFETRITSRRNDPDVVTNILYLCKNGDRTLMDPDRMSNSEIQSTINKSTKHDPDLNYSEGDVVVYARSLRKARPPQNCNHEKKSDIRYDMYQCMSDTTWVKMSSGATTPKGVKYNNSGPAYGLNDLVYVPINDSKPSSIDCSVFDTYQCTESGWFMISNWPSTTVDKGASTYHEGVIYQIGEQVFRSGPSDYPKETSCVGVSASNTIQNIVVEYKGDNLYQIRRTPMGGDKYVDVFLRKKAGSNENIDKNLGSVHGSQGMITIELPTRDEYVVVFSTAKTPGSPYSIGTATVHIGPY